MRRYLRSDQAGDEMSLLKRALITLAVIVLVIIVLSFVTETGWAN